MTDNVTFNRNNNATVPDGTIVATDDISGVQYQIVKLAYGADGAASLVTDDGLPITITVDSPLTRADIEIKTLLKDILLELKKLNIHLSIVSDEDIDDEDIEESFI